MHLYGQSISEHNVVTTSWFYWRFLSNYSLDVWQIFSRETQHMGLTTGRKLTTHQSMDSTQSLTSWTMSLTEVTYGISVGSYLQEQKWLKDSCIPKAPSAWMTAHRSGRLTLVSISSRRLSWSENHLPWNSWYLCKLKEGGALWIWSVSGTSWSFWVVCFLCLKSTIECFTPHLEHPGIFKKKLFF